jgi:osmotically-inducible protein OsmY
MKDDDVVKNVTDELYWDPQVDSRTIAVAARDGAVTLRGTVGSFREKREAKHAAQRVFGVKNVDNKLEVRLLTPDRRDNAELRGDVLRALTLDASVPSTIDASVEDGYVTLSGEAEWKFQRDEAEFVAGNVTGVIEVWNDVSLTAPGPAADDVKDAIRHAFKRNAKLDANGLKVTSSNGTVKLEGSVRSWSEHDDAVAAAWAAPGVRDVDDDIHILY